MMRNEGVEESIEVALDPQHVKVALRACVSGVKYVVSQTVIVRFAPISRRTP